jgi:hypothetical protein
VIVDERGLDEFLERFGKKEVEHMSAVTAANQFGAMGTRPHISTSSSTHSF